MGLHRGQLARLLELDRRIRTGRYPNCTAFALEWEVSRKTIQRDIDFLRDRMQAPIEFDHEHNGYLYTEGSWSLPLLHLSEGELLGLLMAGRMAAQYRGTPLAETLQGLFAKLEEALPERISIDPSTIDAHFSFFGVPSRPIRKQVWMPVLRALRANRVLDVHYCKVGGDQVKRRQIEPLHLACIMDEWYLVAWCREREAIRNFAVAGFEKASASRSIFEPREFDPRAWFDGRFGRYVDPEATAHQVVISFSAEAAPWVAERSWHPQQELKRAGDGTVTLSFPAPALFEVKRWVLGWGADAEVREPAALRRAVAAESRALVDRYRGVRTRGASDRHAWP